MIMQEIWVVMQKEFRQIFRIREMIAIIFVMPLIQMALLGFAISTEVKNVKLVVADQDNSFVSRELVRAFTKVEQFKLVGHVQSEKEIDALIHNWQAQLALVVPKTSVETYSVVRFRKYRLSSMAWMGRRQVLRWVMLPVFSMTNCRNSSPSHKCGNSCVACIW